MEKLRLIQVGQVQVATITATNRSIVWNVKESEREGNATNKHSQHSHFDPRWVCSHMEKSDRSILRDRRDE